MKLKRIMTWALSATLIFGTISPMAGVAAKTVTQKEEGSIYQIDKEPTVKPQTTPPVVLAPTEDVNDTDVGIVPLWTPGPTPGPTGEPLYDTFFWCDTETFYNTNTDTTATARKGLLGFNDLFYGDVRLRSGIDYLDCGANLVLKKEFLDTLPVGDTELTVDANYYTGRPHGKTPLIVHKIDQELPNNYTRKYPASETKEFNSYLQFAQNNYSLVYYHIKSVLKIDKIFVDGEELVDCGITFADTFLEIPYEVIHPLSIGLHKIEVVSGGTSEVLDLVIYDRKMGATDQLNAIMGQSSYEVDAETSVRFYQNYVGINCTINNISSKTMELDKLAVRYYYDANIQNEQIFGCDHAALAMNTAPYYKALTDKVTGEFGDGYVEFKCEDTAIKLNDQRLTIEAHFYQDGWVNYENLVDGHFEILYCGNVIYSSDK